MIDKLLKAMGIRRVAGFVAAPADQIEEFKSSEEIHAHFDKWIDDARFWHARELFHADNCLSGKLAKIATKRADACITLATRERDAEKALEAFEAIE